MAQTKNVALRSNQNRASVFVIQLKLTETFFKLDPSATSVSHALQNRLACVVRLSLRSSLPRHNIFSRCVCLFVALHPSKRNSPEQNAVDRAQRRMLSRAAIPARRALARAMADTTIQRPRMHQPLGMVPSGTDLEAVRSKWGSNAMEKILETDVIEVDGDVAICDGGGGPLGHPVEYIKLLVSDEDAGPQVCKYCGLKYIRKRR